MDARTYAVLALDERDLPTLPRQAFKRKSAVRPADPRDAALGETIVLGVVRNLFLLQHVLAHHAKRPPGKIDPRSRLILLVALFQLKFLDRVPDNAVVNEAVRQARSINSPQSMGFVNAVLREHLRNPDVPLPPPDEAHAHAEVALSHPPECYRRFAAVMGEADALACCRLNNVEPPIVLRLYPGKAADDARAVAPGVEFTPHERDGFVVAAGGKVADFAALADAGVAQVQDPTSARTCTLVDWTGDVLDRCCGVGTKTRQIRSLAPDANLVAADAHGKRVRTLKKAMPGVEAHRLEWLADSPLAGRAFDRVLVDAPCSNSGVIRRRPEARYRQGDEHVAELVDLQRRILLDTLPAVKPGGKLVYATCSVWPEENRQVVDAALAKVAGWSVGPEHVTLPTLSDDPTTHHDGGYAIVLVRDA